jgi:cephalosporin hydroxylase
MSTPNEDEGLSESEESIALNAERWLTMLREMRLGVERDWERAQDALATLVRIQVAQGLAAAFFERKRPWEHNVHLAKMVDNGALDHGAFIQKTPEMLGFYRRLLTGFEREPTSILEIGVKGGGSTAFWKALFPRATVVGVDIKLKRWLTPKPSADGVVYLEGDQTDTAKLEEIAVRYGPFDLVIDDGSHVSDHQAGTLRCLLPHVRPGGAYVIEDIHPSMTKFGHTGTFGEDIWPDFTLAVLQRLRRGPIPAMSPGVKLAGALWRLIADLVVSTQLLAIRTAKPGTPE